MVEFPQFGTAKTDSREMVLKCLQSLCLGSLSWWEEMGHFFLYRSYTDYRPDKEVIHDFIDMF